MSAMSDFEIRANNIATAISTSSQRISDFGYEEDAPEEAVSRIYGMFVTWLTACEEARHQTGYSQSVIAALPDNDDPNWSQYIAPAPTSTLKQRAQALWGIRVAFTHSDGDLNLITNTTNNGYANDAPNHLPGVSISNDRLIITEAIQHTAIRTMVQLHDVLP